MASDSWWRREGEPEEAYAAFLSYRDQALPRSVYRVHYAGNSVRPQQASQWAKAWDWVARAKDFDSSLYEIREAELRETARFSARDKAFKRERLLDTASAIAERELSKLLVACEVTDSPGIVRAETLLGKLPDLIKALRLEHGESTEKIDGGHTECVDVSMCNEEELLAIQEILDKASARGEK